MNGMIHVRRHDHSPRLEMLPLLDVVFLLLTFFIYSLLVMVPAKVLPIQLVPVGEGEPAEARAVVAITLDRAGRFYVDREPVDAAALDARLAELAAEDEPARLVLAMEETLAAGQGDAGEATVDRAPMLIALIGRVQRAGLHDFAVVGPDGAAEDAAGERGSGGP